MVLRLRSVKLVEIEAAEDTYNLVVEGEHNYFVGHERVLVHNGAAGEYTVYIGDDGYIGITKDFDRRYKEWLRKGRRISPLQQGLDYETARGVEQIKIQEQWDKGIRVNTNNSIDPARTDERAVRMRKLGKDFLNGPEC